MGFINQFVEKVIVDGVNKGSEFLNCNKGNVSSVFLSSNSEIIKFTLDQEEWIEIAKDIGKKSSTGAAIDGAFALYKASLLYKNGHIEKKDFAKHIISELGCGFLSSATGNAGSVTIKILTGNKTASFIVGIGVSAGTRWLYRKAVPGYLPEVEGKEDEEDEELAVREILDQIRN